MTSLLPKRSLLEDFDDSDPLADFSLSDDDFFDGPSKKPVTDTASKKSSTLGDTENKNDNQSRKIADLFGLDENNELSKEPDQVVKKDKANWLGLKESPKSEKKNLQNQNIPDKNSTSVEYKSMEKISESSEKVGGFDISSSLSSDVSQRNRRRSEGMGIMKSAESKKGLFKSLDIPLEMESVETPKRVSFSDTTKRADAGDYFGNLHDLDELLPDDPAPTQTMNASYARGYELQPKAQETTVLESEEKFQNTQLKDYVPSSASSVPSARRPSFGRRRDSIIAPKTSSASLRPQFEFDFGEPLSSFRMQEPLKDTNLQAIKTTETTKFSDTQDLGYKDKREPLDSRFKSEISAAQKEKSQLPSWLTGQTTLMASNEEPDTTLTSIVESTAPLKEETNIRSTSETTTQNDKDVNESAESHLQLAVSLGEKTLVSEKTIQSLQQTHTQLLSVLRMQQQKEVMDSITSRQLTVLHKQEEQINQLIQKHMEKQLKAEAIIEKQMQQINDIILVLMSQPDPQPGFPSITPDERDAENKEAKTQEVPAVDLNLNKQILNLEANIQHLEFENKKLRLNLELVESRYQLEFEATEKNLNYELDMKSRREEKLVKSLEEMEKEYEEKLSKLKNSHAEVVKSYEEKVETLQNERMKDFQKLSDLQRSVLEQALTFNSQAQMQDFSKLLRPTFFEIKKPENEEELSEREAKLMEKEKQLASKREALNRQKLALESEYESVADKSQALDIEKMEQRMRSEKEMRQIKSERNMLVVERKAWQDEKEADLRQIEHLKHQVEVMRASMLKQQEAIIQEKLEIASERAQINAITKVQGANLTTTIDLAQARAEVDGAMEAAKQAERTLDEETQSLLEKKRQMMNETWKLTEREQEVTARENFVRQLLEESQRKKEESLEALRQARTLEKEVINRRSEIQDKINELGIQEQNLSKERLEIAREWKELNKSKAQLELILPELTSEEKSLLQPTSRQNYTDRNLIIYKLPAEREGDGFRPFPSVTRRDTYLPSQPKDG